MKYAQVENAPTIPAFSAGKRQLLGKGKAVSLSGYIQAQTNNVLLEATNLYKQTNLEEEEGETIYESKPDRCSPPPPGAHPHLSSGKLLFLILILQKNAIDTSGFTKHVESTH